MTEYTMRGDEPITEITDWDTRNRYLKQAKELYQSGEAYDMTFLPIAEGFNDILYPLVQSNYERMSREDTQAYSYIMQKTLEETFKRGNPQHDSNLIIRMSKEDVNDRHKANIDEWRALTLRAIQEQMRKDPEWFGKLTPAAQLTAIGMELHMTSRGSSPRLQYEEGLKFDFAATPENTYSADLSQSANIILTKAYKRNNDNAYPLDDSQLTWEVKAAALEAQLKSHGGSWKEKIPSLPVFVDLLKTAEKPAQQLKLAELAKEPDFKESMRYDGFRNELRQSFKDMAPCGEATQKLFYEVLYNFDLRGINEPKLQLTDINFGTLQAAVAECKAQRIVDEVNNQVDLNYKEIAKLNKKLKTEGLSKQEKEFIEKQADDLQKKNVITGIPDIELVAKYRPQFLEQPAKMTPDLCAQIVNKYGDKLPAQTQLEMMTKVIIGLKNNDVKYDAFPSHIAKGGMLKIAAYYIEKASKLNTSSRAMKKFKETMKSIVDNAEKQYGEDKKLLNAAAKAKNEKVAAERECELFDKARSSYLYLDEIQKKIKNMRDSIKVEEPSDDTLAKFMTDGLAGKEVKLTYELKKSLGLFVRNKKEQTDLAKLIMDFNDKMQTAQLSDCAKYLSVAGGERNDYLSKENELKSIREATRNVFEIDYSFTAGEENRVAMFEEARITDKFAALEKQFEERSKEMQGRARTDLAMQFGEQQFEERSKEMQGRARKPLEGLVKEEEMAQGIYKAKIAELRQSIKDGVKQDMTDRGVNEKPSLDNPNEVGKPMTKENTAKIRKNMKDLKQYKQLVKE